MNRLSNIILALLALLIAANFYMDMKRERTMQKRIDTLDSLVAKPKEEPSPFDHAAAGNDRSMMKPILDTITSISFEHTAYDFGSIESGPEYKTSFKFTNTGQHPLVISGAVGSCGCTIPTWEEAPVLPGHSGELTVEFDSKGRVGQQLKTITVTANTQPPTNVLTIKALPYLKTK